MGIADVCAFAVLDGLVIWFFSTFYTLTLFLFYHDAMLPDRA